SIRAWPGASFGHYPHFRPASPKQAKEARAHRDPPGFRFSLSCYSYDPVTTPPPLSTRGRPRLRGGYRGIPVLVMHVWLVALVAWVIGSVTAAVMLGRWLAAARRASERYGTVARPQQVECLIC